MISSVHLPLLVSLLLAGISPALTVTTPTAVLSERIAVHGGRVAGPVPAILAAALVTVIAVVTIRVEITLRRRRRITRWLREFCETCAIGPEELVVAPIAHPQAFAVPARLGRSGVGGRILVTAGMLRALDAPGRRALLAHERAHLMGHHHCQRAIVDIAAAINPLLIPVRTAVAYLVERAADECAADVIGDRRGAADALATAALAGDTPVGTHRGVSPGAALAYSRLGVAHRVAALNAAPLPERRLPPVLLIALATLTATETLHTIASFTLAELGNHALPGW